MLALTDMSLWDFPLDSPAQAVLMASLTKTIQKPVDVMRRLEKQIRELESLQRAHTGVISSGCPAMDAFLPHGGYSCGSLAEFVSDQGMALGLTTMALQIAKSACADGKYIVVIDSELQLFPQALKQLGVPLDRLICLRPSNYSDFLWGLDQTLRNGSVGAVIASVERMDDRTARRIQLAAEAGGGLGILLRSLDSIRRYTSWAEVQWFVHASSHGPDFSASGVSANSAGRESVFSRLTDREKVGEAGRGTRWFDLILRRSPGSHSVADSGHFNSSPKRQLGKRLRLGIDSTGQWATGNLAAGDLAAGDLVTGQWAVPQVSTGSISKPTSVFSSGISMKREARNEQTDHVRLAAELASTTRDRRSLAG